MQAAEIKKIKNTEPFVYSLIAFLISFVAYLWIYDSVLPNHLLMEVPKVSLLPFLESPWTYFYLHFFTVLPVLSLSFSKGVAYYKRWKYLFPAIGIVGAIFIAWDVYFTYAGVWGFNEKYFIGVRLFFLPVEEWLFFITVPFACVFIYECIRYYFKEDILSNYQQAITVVCMLSFFIIGFLNLDRLYTATTFILSGAFLLFHYVFIGGNYRGRFYLAYLLSCIPFMVINGVLTGGYTQEPVVIYNPEEYFGIRITSIPVDDSIYSFLLLLGVITIYENFQKNFLLNNKGNSPKK